MLVVNETSLGRPESAWKRLQDLPELAPIDPCRILVIAPHPDDETLGVGGTLSMLHEQGCSIAIVAVTNGEASHPHSYTHAPSQMAELRMQEQRAALADLGLSVVHRLGLPDGGVSAHERELAASLGRLFRGASLCFAPFEGDGHPDHEATGRAAIEACRTSGVRLLRYPIWAFHDADPASAIWASARRIELNRLARAAKLRAIMRFQSQIAPLSPLPGDARILPPTVLDRFRRPFEVVIE